MMIPTTSWLCLLREQAFVTEAYQNETHGTKTPYLGPNHGNYRLEPNIAFGQHGQGFNVMALPPDTPLCDSFVA